MNRINTLLLALVFSLLFFSNAWAQTSELTSADRLALLYVKQLNFSSNKEPQIRIRVAEALEKIHFFSPTSFRVQPQGPGGPEIKLPGNQNYSIELKDGKPGTYRFFVILDRFQSENFSLAENARKYWQEAGEEAEIIEIGAIFAIKGKIFDNREHLVVGKSSESEEKIKKHLANLEKKYDKSFDMHAQLIQYPSAKLILRDELNHIEITHLDTLWILAPDEGITLLNIPSEDGKTTNNQKFLQHLIFSPDKSAKLAISNSAGIETILRGIVPLEIYPSAPEAALSAQAIAARGTLIAQIGRRHLADPYHVCNLQHCQVHAGAGAAKQSSDIAIKKSSGEILFYDQKIVQSYYSSHCGGFSANAQSTWAIPNLPYLQSLSDDEKHQNSTLTENAFLSWWHSSPQYYCSAKENETPFSSMKHARWQETREIKELQITLKERKINIGEIQDITINERDESFRAYKISIKGSKGEYSIQRELPIRRLFKNLKSALFTFEKEFEHGKLARLKFYGAGFGHGVGLCQTGAMGMALQGKSAKDILQHYYPNTNLDKLW